MFIATPSTIAKLRKEPKCPPTDKEIVVYIHKGILYLAVRKNEIWPFVTTWMELESVMLSEINHTDKTDTIWFHSYVDPEKLNRRSWGRGRKKKEREGAKP